MKCAILDPTTHELLCVIEDIPMCGEDFCDACGLCLACLEPNNEEQACCSHVWFRHADE